MESPISNWKGNRKAERENRVWDRLLKQFGAHALEEKLRRMPAHEGEHLNSYNAYNRKWPFDAKKTLVGLDLVSDFIPSGSMDMTEALIMQEAQDTFLDSLTDKQRFVVTKTGEGYKPREIAAMQGDDESGKVRWHLFASRKKLRDKIDD